MPQGVRTPNLPTSSTVIELIGNKDLGGGNKQTVRMALADFLAFIEDAFSGTAAAAIDLATARAAADAARALGVANNAHVRLNQLDDVQIKLRAEVFN